MTPAGDWTVRDTVSPMAYYRLDSDAMSGPLPPLASNPTSVARRPLDEHEMIIDRLLGMSLPALPVRHAEQSMRRTEPDDVVPSEATAVGGTRRRAFRVIRRTA